MKDFYRLAIEDMIAQSKPGGLAMSYVRSRLGSTSLEEWARQTLLMGEMEDDAKLMAQTIWHYCPDAKI